MAEKELRLKRDDEGNLMPIDGVSPTLGLEVKILPMTYGAARRLDSFGKTLDEYTDEDRFTVITEHVLEPDLKLKSVDDMVNNFDPFTLDDLFQCVFLYSGIFRLYKRGEEEGNEVREVLESLT